MILDTSAILAIVFQETEQDDCLRKIGGAPMVGVGAPTLVETTMVTAARLGEQAHRLISAMVDRPGLWSSPSTYPIYSSRPRRGCGLVRGAIRQH